jgi:hypothetical protein
MKNRRLINTVISISGMLLLIALAYGLDAWRESNNRYYTETFKHLYEIYWSYVIGNLVLSTAIVIWSWFVLVKVDLEKWIYAIFICIGLLITIYPILYFTPIGVLDIAYRLSPAFQVYLTCGIIAMVGFLKGFIQRKKSQADLQPSDNSTWPSSA